MEYDLKLTYCELIQLRSFIYSEIQREQDLIRTLKVKNDIRSEFVSIAEREIEKYNKLLEKLEL